jgi:hypothetical protein
MAGIADLFYRFSGTPDPSQQLAALLAGRQQAQAASPGPADPNAPAPNAQPVSADAPAPAATPGAPPPPGSPPQPQALQSTPDMSASYQQLANGGNLMSLYLQMQQRQQASDQINRGFALIAANHSSPAMANAIMGSVGGGPDAGQEVGNIMKLYQAQQGMAAQQQLMQQAPELAQKLGMSEATVRAEILAGRGPELIKSMEPTDTMRNYNQARTQLINQGMSPEEATRTLQPMLMGMQSNPELADFTQQYLAAKASGTLGQHPELMGGFEHWRASVQAQATGQREAETNKQEAVKQFSTLDGNLGRYVDTLGEISSNKFLTGDPNDPNSPSLVNHPWVDMSKFSPGMLGSDRYALHQKITDLQGTAKALVNQGGALTKGALAGIAPMAEGLTHYGLTGDAYRSDVIEPQLKAALTAQANNYVAAGKTDQMPGYLRPYADQTTPLLPRAGVKPNPKLKQLDQEDITTAQAHIEKVGPKAVISQLKTEGYDTSPLE